MKKILLGLLVLMTTIVSCTDNENEDIDIEYQAEVGITAAHIFDDYEQFQIGDFDMSIDGWKLNLSVRVYDESGKLVDKTETLCNSLSETLNYAPYLAPGEYTVVSIADFREGLGGTEYKFWNIENESNIQDLSITENDSYYPVVFETLGIDVQKIEITNSSKSIIADIKPVTSLVHVYMSDKDYSGWGLDGYSRFVALSDGYFIKALKAKDNVRFKNGKCTFNYSEQYSNYNLAISEVHSKWEDKRPSTSYIYRALLPEENKGFSFHIQKRELPQEDYDRFITYCGEFDSEGTSEILPEIASNKQYVVNMIFDAMKLDVMEYPADYNHERYTEQFVKDYNKQLMSNMVNIKYENILGQDENYANVFLDMEPEDYNNSANYYTAHYPHSRANHFESYVSASYLNPDYTVCLSVQLLLPDLSEDMFVYLKGLLSNKFVAEEEGKFGPNYFTYLEPGKTEDDSKYRVVLEKKHNEAYNKYTYFIQYVLREKFQPQEESLWADFTTLFGADKNTVKSTMEGLGHSYSFPDYSYSDYGSDYYNINNNNYANMVGFVFNSDYQVSQFWVYYISTKVNDVYDYLTQKYTAAESESSNYVKVFYNDKKDIKVVLDLINGAVIYTKLDMKQHSKNLYTPGDANGWSHNSSQMLFTSNHVNYYGFANLSAGGFKFSSAPNWNYINYGDGGKEGKLSTDGSAGNLTVTQSGLYWCDVNIATLTWDATKIGTIGIIGSFNGWAQSKPLTSEDGLIWSGTITFNKGDEYKFRCNNDWAINLGGADGYTLVPDGSNLTAPATGTYTITLDLSVVPYTYHLK